MGHLEGNFTPVLYMGRKVHKGNVRQEALMSLIIFCPWFVSIGYNLTCLVMRHIKACSRQA